MSHSINLTSSTKTILLINSLPCQVQVCEAKWAMAPFFVPCTKNGLAMKKHYLTTIWAFSALMVMSQPPLTDTTTRSAIDNTTYILDTSHIAHRSSTKKKEGKTDSSTKKVSAHEVHKNYRYEVKASPSLAKKGKS